jgi:hypothetical protein
MVEKSLMITKFSDTISSGKNSLLLSFLRYPFLPGHLSLCTDTHFHIKLYTEREGTEGTGGSDVTEFETSVTTVVTDCGRK